MMNTIVRWLIGRPSAAELTEAYDIRRGGMPQGSLWARNVMNRDKIFADMDSISYDLPLDQKFEIYLNSIKEVWPQRIRHFTQKLHDL